MPTAGLEPRAVSIRQYEVENYDAGISLAMNDAIMVLLLAAPFALIGAVVALLIVQIGNDTRGQRK
jgi:hypothetical protein